MTVARLGPLRQEEASIAPGSPRAFSTFTNSLHEDSGGQLITNLKLPSHIFPPHAIMQRGLR